MLHSIEAKLFIQEKAAIIWAQYQQTYNCGELCPILYEVKSSKTAGFAYYSGKVAFNLSYFCSTKNLVELEQIIAHELAHIVQYRCYPQAKQAHGPEFKMILMLAGYKTDTYHHIDVAAAKSKAADLVDEKLFLLL